MSEESEEILNTFPTINHTISPMLPSTGISKKTEPIEVATPFPPEKLRNGE